MGTRIQWQLRMIDVVGGCIVTGCLIAFLYLSVIQTEANAQEVRRFAQAIKVTQRRMSKAQATAQEHQDALRNYKERLATQGHLPAHAPVEAFFRFLSATADHHNVRVVGQKPLTPRTYPGLCEHRFSYDVTGTFPNITRFLRAIERSDYWADVAYLKIDRPRSANASTSTNPAANLTISMFTAVSEDGVDTNG